MVRERSQPKSGRDDGQPCGSAQSGCLYVVSTPIGNPEDITIRALRILRTVSIIASEDPGATQALLAHHHAIGNVTSYGPRNLDEKIALLLDRLQRGYDVALVSDCGTPVVYDPGCRLIKVAHRAGIPVRSVPGPSALTAAISISGCSGDSFLFGGHLPKSRRSLNAFLSGLRHERRTVVFFAPSQSIEPVLIVLTQIAPMRRVVLAQDLTRPGEQTLQGRPSMLLKRMRRFSSGETVTVVVEGPASKSRAM